MSQLCSKCNKRYRCHNDLCDYCFKKKRQDNAPKIKCQCSDECEEIISSITLSGKPCIYARYHWPKKSGEDHYNWKGGIKIVEGYRRILAPDHPQHDTIGRVAEHRLIYEQHYNCCLLPWTIIHHIDRNRSNNDISNLMPIINQASHMSLHMKKDMNRTCLLCDTNKTYIDKQGYSCWHIYEYGFICQKCYKKIPKNKDRANHLRRKRKSLNKIKV